MNTTIRLLACGLVAAAAGVMVRAAGLPEARTKGRVLVLVNERTLEGDILQIGSDYRIRRAVGESWVPGNKVLRLCVDWKEAYVYLKMRANEADPDERIRLARWCQLHGLHEQALGEADAAVKLRPTNAEARRLQNLLRRAVATTQAARSSPLPVAPPPSPLPAVDLNTESLSLFATRVQPILMNACASCHASNYRGEFHLLRSPYGSINQRATRHNLAAAVAQVDKQRPEMSPLLIKAVSMHGNTRQVPLKGRQSAAFRNLQNWVETTLASNPHLAAAAARTAVGWPNADKDGGVQSDRPPESAPADNIASFRAAEPADRSEPGQATVVSMSGSRGHNLPPEPEAVSAAGGPASVGGPPAPRARPTPKPEPPPPADPVDPFDPVIFNRQMHPEKP
jgi:hypothetical protein